MDRFNKLRLEVLFSFVTKAFSFGVSLILITKLTGGEAFYRDLVYVFGLFNMSRILDGGLPYLQRICHAKQILIASRSQLIFSAAMVFIQMVLFFMITGGEFILSLLLGVYGRLYAACNYKLNVLQKSYYLYLANALPLLISIFVYEFLSFDHYLIFCLSNIFFAILFFLFHSSGGESRYSVLQIRQVWDSNVSFNVITMLVFFFYAEFAAVFLYGRVPPDDYDQINIFTRVVLLFVGLGSILSTSIWNYAGIRPSNIDRILISPLSYFLPAVLVIALLYYLHYFDVVNRFLGDQVFAYLALGLCGVFSIATLNHSQFLARMEASYFMLMISSMELLGMVMLLVFYENIEIYYSAISILILLKFFVGSYLCARLIDTNEASGSRRKPGVANE